MTETSTLRAGGGAGLGEMRLGEMKAEADHARRRYDLYKARTYGPRPTSPARLRQLERDSERAASTLKRASTDA